jgi:peroxiredoxin
MLQSGHPLPAFSLPLYPTGELSNDTLIGQNTVIFVYPKDDTYG